MIVNFTALVAAEERRSRCRHFGNEQRDHLHFGDEQRDRRHFEGEQRDRRHFGDETAASQAPTRADLGNRGRRGFASPYPNLPGLFGEGQGRYRRLQLHNTRTVATMATEPTTPLPLRGRATTVTTSGASHETVATSGASNYRGLSTPTRADLGNRGRRVLLCRP